MPSSMEPSDSVAIIGRAQLKSSDPDLDVVLGADGQVLRYHSVYLASFSEYIDTMLATPMKEQALMRITFPDIEPDVWNKMMRFLEPGGTRDMGLDEFEQVLPFFDKYGFQIALKVCDRIFFDLLDRPVGDFLLRAKVAIMSYKFGDRSKERAVQFTKKYLPAMRFFHRAETDTIRDLLRLLQDDEETLRFIVSCVVGHDDTTIEDMRLLVEEDSFASLYLTRCLQLSEQDAILQKCQVKKVDIASAGTEPINGTYEKRDPWLTLAPKKPGIMDCAFVKTVEWNGTTGKAALEPMDPFGKKWQISITADNESAEEDHVSIPLYVWQSDFSSLLPPMYGWSVQDEGELPAPELEYHISSSGY